MITESKDIGDEILSHTLTAVRRQRRWRKTIRPLLVTSAAIFMIGTALLATNLENPRSAATSVTPVLPVLPVLPTAAAPDVELDWIMPRDNERLLLLVVGESGMEMKALSRNSISRLARQPGCRFEFAPGSLLWVSEGPVDAGTIFSGADF